MKHLVFALPAVVFAPLLAAAEWTAVAPGTTNRLVFDRSSVVVRGNLARVMSQAEFQPAAEIPMPPRRAARVVSLLEFDCATGSERAVWTRIYGAGDSIGQLVAVRQSARPAPAGSIGERLMLQVCPRTAL